LCVAWILLAPATLSVGILPAESDELALEWKVQLAATCGKCHAVPSPEIAARYRWPFIFGQMHQHADQFGQSLNKEVLETLLDYYQRHAPEALPALPQIQARAGLRVRWQYLRDAEPRVTHVQVVDLDQNGAADILICDAGKDTVSWMRPAAERMEELPLAGSLTAPARIEVFDFDKDGDLDIAVPCLGRVLPTDDLIGSLTLLVNDGQQQFTPQVLLTSVARVADARAADFDGDGDLDFVVALFGWVRSGSIGWLEQLAPQTFHLHELFSFPGTVNVAVTDVNKDQRPDFIALVSQAQEQVLAFLNLGSGSFAPKTLYDAHNPLFGSSGMKLVDLDQDGDQDILFSNGDVFDSQPELRPYSGIQWLENRGALDFVYHDLARFYGAFSPTAADLDGDGDLDVVATSFFSDWTDRRRQSLVWLENDGQMRFALRPLSNTPTDLVTADVGDLDGDGRPDVVAGSLKVGRAERLYGPPERRARLGVWINRGVQ
jgi:hypothetical protein